MRAMNTNTLLGQILCGATLALGSLTRRDRACGRPRHRRFDDCGRIDIQS